MLEVKAVSMKRSAFVASSGREQHGTACQSCLTALSPSDKQGLDTIATDLSRNHARNIEQDVQAQCGRDQLSFSRARAERAESGLMPRVSMIRLEYKDWTELFRCWQTPAFSRPKRGVFEAKFVRFFTRPPPKEVRRRAQRSPLALQMWKRSKGKLRGCHRYVGIVTLFLDSRFVGLKRRGRTSVLCIVCLPHKSNSSVFAIAKVQLCSACVDPRCLERKRVNALENHQGLMFGYDQGP